jgi:hypothetical protein
VSTGTNRGLKQRLRSARRELFGAVTVSLILGLALLAGCGGDDSKTALPVERVDAKAFDSPYCVTARKWAVHELTGGGDGAYARGGPAALEKWWNEQLAYLKTSLRQAPPAVQDAEAVNELAIRTRLTPLVEKYGFDFERVAAEASASEKAFADHPPAELAKAQEVRNLYQNRVCGYGGPPPAADVTFTASASAKPYCEAVALQRKHLDEFASSGFDPEAFRSYVTSDSFSGVLDKQTAKAPSEIATDVKTDIEWVRTRWLEVAEEFDYDLRRILLEGSADDVAAFTFWAPAIVEQDSRITAYQEQACGG